jgi:hypothetical protein
MKSCCYLPKSTFPKSAPVLLESCRARCTASFGICCSFKPVAARGVSSNTSQSSDRGIQLSFDCEQPFLPPGMLDKHMLNEPEFRSRYWNSVGITMTSLPQCGVNILELDRFPYLSAERTSREHVRESSQSQPRAWFYSPVRHVLAPHSPTVLLHRVCSALLDCPCIWVHILLTGSPMA